MSFIVHAGVHKTASTSLQELVFSDLQDCFYVGKSRLIMASRGSDFLSRFFDYMKSIEDDVHRININSAAHCLALLIDARVNYYRNSKQNPQWKARLEKSIELLSERLRGTSHQKSILYSNEGLVNNLMHIYPEAKKMHKLPISKHQKLFPTGIERLILYLREPRSYLLSRYIQIHSIRYTSKRAMIPIKEYFDFQAKLWENGEKEQSLFLHIFEDELKDYLNNITLSKILVRNFEKNLADCKSVSTEISDTFNLKCQDPLRADDLFANKRLNTSDSGTKKLALPLLLKANQCESSEELKDKTFETLERIPLLKQYKTLG